MSRRSGRELRRPAPSRNVLPRPDSAYGALIRDIETQRIGAIGREIEFLLARLRHRDVRNHGVEAPALKPQRPIFPGDGDQPKGPSQRIGDQLRDVGLDADQRGSIFGVFAQWQGARRVNSRPKASTSLISSSMAARARDPPLRQLPPDSTLDPGAIAQTYLSVLAQKHSAWTWEIELRPWA